MGAWGLGPFENDSAVDLLDELREEEVPAVALAELFEGVIQAPPDAYFDADDGQRCVAACSLVLAVCEAAPVPNRLAEVVADLEVDDELLHLALHALPRVLDGHRSELVQLVGELTPFEDLYERLVTIAQDNAELPAIDLRKLLAP